MNEELEQVVDMMNSLINVMISKDMFKTLAAANFNYFVELTNAGFTEEQAMRIVERATISNFKQ